MRYSAATPDQATSPVTPVGGEPEVKPLPANPVARVKRARRKAEAENLDFYKSRGLWDDIKTGRWMLVPSECHAFAMAKAHL